MGIADFFRKPEGLPEAWTLEVQIHPADIRRRVRYLFLTRPQVTAWSILILLYLSLLALAVCVTPAVVGGMVNRHEYRALAAERSLQGERLQELVGRLDQLHERTNGLQLRMTKIFLAYGLPSESPGISVRTLPAPVLPDSVYAGAIQQGVRLQARIGDRLEDLDESLREIRAFEQTHAEEVRNIPAVCPLRDRDFVLTSPFGRRRSPYTKEFDFHAGIDLAAPRGKPVHATSDGVVVFAGQVPMARSAFWWRFGNLVVVRNGDQFVTLYGHCDEIRVRAGQRVSQGDVLATVGNTGFSSSPHLHYEVRRRGADGELRPVNPLIYILDHRWQNEERWLVQARNPVTRGYEPLPPGLGR